MSFKVFMPMRSFDVFVNFEKISYLVLEFILMALNR